MEKIFQSTKSFFLHFLIVLFPLFFLTTTQEFFITNKLYLLAFGVLILMIVSGLELLFTKKLNWETKPLDVPVVLFISSLILTVIFSSPNKVQAFLNPHFGLTIFLTLGVLYFYLSRIKNLSSYLGALKIVGIVLSIITIVLFFQPFKNITLSSNFQFLKNPLFTPLGSLLDLAVFLGFILILNIFYVIPSSTKRNLTAGFVFLTLNFLALSLTLYTIFTNSLIIPPFSNSWLAVLEVMKNVKTAFFGAGIDNFSAVFTRVKDLAYNQSPLWQIDSFNVSRNLPLHIVVEAGILGFSSFVLLVVIGFKQLTSVNLNKSQLVSLFIYWLISSLIFPPSLPLLFLLFLVLGAIANSSKQPQPKHTDLSDLPLLYLGIALILLIAAVSGGYLLSRSYSAEYFFKKAISGFTQNSAKEVYDNLKKARILNPYQERFVLNFSQINLLIANNLATKDQEQITDQDRQTITQAIQAAISEAKILVSLNPNKSRYFENLANIYRNIIPLATNADAWTVSAYQRAIVLDPINPSYRIGLGGVYYLLGQYGDAVRLFEQAVSFKPDWANANYNLAWGYFQNKEYDKATAVMQNVVKLVDKNTNPKDFEKASQELEDFKNRLADQEEKTSEGELNLPQQSTTELDPKLNLPPEASPEAN